MCTIVFENLNSKFSVIWYVHITYIQIHIIAMQLNKQIYKVHMYIFI